jgi:hypothetical protein
MRRCGRPHGTRSDRLGARCPGARFPQTKQKPARGRPGAPGVRPNRASRSAEGRDARSWRETDSRKPARGRASPNDQWSVHRWDLGSERSPSRHRSSGGTSRTSLPRDSVDQLSARQQAALDVIAARHPRPITSAQLATELQLAPGALNVTLRSLQRRQLIAVVPATARRRGAGHSGPGHKRQGGVADTAAGFVIVDVPTRATRPTARCSTTPSNARRDGVLAAPCSPPAASRPAPPRPRAITMASATR